MDGCYFLAVIEDVAHAHSWFGEVVRKFRSDRYTALHVARSQAEEQISLEAMRQIAGCWHGVEMPRDDHPRLGVRGLGHHGVSRSMHCHVAAFAKRRFHGIGQLVLVVGLTGDIDQCGGEINNISRQVQWRSHVDTVAG